jgi:hypothetical protein
MVLAEAQSDAYGPGIGLPTPKLRSVQVPDLLCWE